jgi:translation initiation factor 3 subunit F
MSELEKIDGSCRFWKRISQPPQNCNSKLTINQEQACELLPSGHHINMADTGSFLHLARPLGPASVGTQPSTAPLSVVVQPQVLFQILSITHPILTTRKKALLSILDHSLRRNPDQERVIGTLLGHRTEDGTEVEIRNCYAVPHTETQEQVEVDMDYQKQMLALHLRANPREVLVGWYATSSDLNTFSALIQNFYGQQGDGTWPHPAVHLTVSTVPGKDIEARTYISAPIGVTAERAADSCLFIPVPYEIKYGEPEKSGLELISGAKDREDRTAGVVTDIESLERALENVLEMLETVSNYVNNVLDEEATPSSALGQFLMNTLSLAPKVDPADIERDFNNHIQDVLVVSYLANTIRTQIDLSNRLATAALTLGGDAAAGAQGSAEGGQKGGQQQRGGKGRTQNRPPQE